MKKIVVLSLIWLSAVQGAEVKYDDPDKGSTTAQIQAKVNRVLENFRHNMDEYYKRTGNSKRISMAPLNPLAAPSSKQLLEKEIQKTWFQKINDKFEEYKHQAKDNFIAYKQKPDLAKLRHDIIMDFNHLMRSGELQDSEKKQAIEIAKNLDSPTLKARLEVYDLGTVQFSILSPDILHLIIAEVLKDGSIEDIQKLLKVNKGFHWNLLSQPARLSFKGFKGKMNDQALATIVQLFPQVKELDLSDCRKITNKGLHYLKGLKNLTHLDLSHTNITNEGLKNLKDLANLTHLNLNGTKITGEGLKNLEGLTSLTYLDLSVTYITGEGLKNLEGLTSLTYLDLSHTEITGEELKNLKDLTSLTYLSLNRTDTTDEGLKNLKGLTSLTHLSLNRTDITGEGLENLKGLTSLIHLSLNGIDITGEGLKNLEGLTSLTHLSLNHTNITDEGLKNLEGLTSLTHLSLLHTKITDAGLENLKGLTNLTYLDLFDCHRITKGGVAALKAALPHLQIRMR